MEAAEGARNLGRWFGAFLTVSLWCMSKLSFGVNGSVEEGSWVASGLLTEQLQVV